MEYNQAIPKPRIPVLCWGHKDLPKQNGIVTYRLSPNQIKISKHFWTQRGWLNTLRRCSSQFLYVVPPMFAAYLLMTWAEDKSRFLNSKEGRALYGDVDDG
ncbi:hypothetical protein WHR41_07150 [Cladosporium halotolerans]|uniref:Cytochrome b-c1 complex subunit 8 n=1 Tax=Cladosporium halotolerans TaxID=1052096 RepID=A0AB34KKM1_9PEZI